MHFTSDLKIRADPKKHWHISCEEPWRRYAKHLDTKLTFLINTYLYLTARCLNLVEAVTFSLNFFPQKDPVKCVWTFKVERKRNVGLLQNKILCHYMVLWYIAWYCMITTGCEVKLLSVSEGITKILTFGIIFRFLLNIIQKYLFHTPN